MGKKFPPDTASESTPSTPRPTDTIFKLVVAMTSIKY